MTLQSRPVLVCPRVTVTGNGKGFGNGRGRSTTVLPRLSPTPRVVTPSLGETGTGTRDDHPTLPLLVGKLGETLGTAPGTGSGVGTRWRGVEASRANLLRYRDKPKTSRTPLEVNTDLFVCHDEVSHVGVRLWDLQYVEFILHVGTLEPWRRSGTGTEGHQTTTLSQKVKLMAGRTPSPRLSTGLKAPGGPGIPEPTDRKVPVRRTRRDIVSRGESRQYPISPHTFLFFRGFSRPRRKRDLEGVTGPTPFPGDPTPVVETTR